MPYTLYGTEPYGYEADNEYQFIFDDPEKRSFDFFNEDILNQTLSSIREEQERERAQRANDEEEAKKLAKQQTREKWAQAILAISQVLASNKTEDVQRALANYAQLIQETSGRQEALREREKEREFEAKRIKEQRGFEALQRKKDREHATASQERGIEARGKELEAGFAHEEKILTQRQLFENVMQQDRFKHDLTRLEYSQDFSERMAGIAHANAVELENIGHGNNLTEIAARTANVVAQDIASTGIRLDIAQRVADHTTSGKHADLLDPEAKGALEHYTDFRKAINDEQRRSVIMESVSKRLNTLVPVTDANGHAVTDQLGNPIMRKPTLYEIMSSYENIDAIQQFLSAEDPEAISQLVDPITGRTVGEMREEIEREQVLTELDQGTGWALREQNRAKQVTNETQARDLAKAWTEVHGLNKAKALIENTSIPTQYEDEMKTAAEEKALEMDQVKTVSSLFRQILSGPSDQRQYDLGRRKQFNTDFLTSFLGGSDPNNPAGINPEETMRSKVLQDLLNGGTGARSRGIGQF